jgi:hypothetical protein
VPTETTSLEHHPASTATAPAPEVSRRRRDQLAAATGIVFVALQLPIVAILSGAPAIDDPPAVIRDYLVDDSGRILLAFTLVTVAAFFFIWFLGSVHTLLRNAEGADGRLSMVAVGAGLVTIALNVTAGVPAVALAWNDTAAAADPGLLQAVWTFNTLALVPIGATAAAFSLAVAVVILRTRALPTWLGGLGIVSTILGVASVFYIVADGDNTALGIVNLAGFLVGMLFILLLSILTVMRLAKTGPVMSSREGPG